CFMEFGNNPKLGIGGGAVYDLLINGNLELAKDPLFHVRGATKIYKRGCWDAVGGLIMAPGWDTLDEVKANMLGYTTKRFANIKLIQHRATGLADGTWANWVKNGRANYISGYHPIFMFFKCIKRFFQKPYFLAALGLFYGFLNGYFNNIPQISDGALINYLRRQQINRLIGKKSIWR
ncbi:MAG: glycosyltransferase family 2 protein, partial [Candidatus Omnitrophica bacterium]|nr:glycosyltransferase family 2 protein [Candidatus Omnitrophota bacterium]